MHNMLNYQKMLKTQNVKTRYFWAHGYHYKNHIYMVSMIDW